LSSRSDQKGQNIVSSRVGNGAKFGSLTGWGVQALGKRMRQRKGAKICLFNAAARQALSQWMRQRHGAEFCPFSTPAFFKRRILPWNETFRSGGTFILAGLN